MKSFDIEKAKAGAKVCTRNGLNVRILCYDVKCIHDVLEIVALVDEFGCETVHHYNMHGRISNAKEHDLDLMMATEMHEGWVNIYENRNPGGQFFGYIIGRLHKNEKDAKESIMPYSRLVKTIKIEWED